MTDIRRIETDGAPAAIGPYSQAVVVDGWIYVSGQIPLDPTTGEVVQGDVSQQTERVLRSLRAVLEEAGGSMETVVRATVYLDDMANFSRVNEVYSRHFGSHRPARAAIEAGALPKGVAVEIDAVARVR